MPCFRSELAGRRVGVWGLGKEGRAVVHTVVENGAADVFAVDSKAPDGVDFGTTVTVSVGEDRLDEFLSCDVVFLSPGIPWHHPVVEALRASEVIVSSATDLFLSSESERTVGITGTKGKSTTASFTAHLLARVGVPAALAGNIGTPLLEVPDSDGRVVAEMSSQQSAVLRRSPRIAVVTNLGEDHLDWHGSVDEYYRAKANVFARGSEVLVCESHALGVLRALSDPPVAFPERVVTEAAIVDRWPDADSVDPRSPMLFAHNRINGQLAALTVEEVLGRPLTTDELCDAMNTFGSLPHRLELVREVAGKRWYDDTLATTADSVTMALRSMPADVRIGLIVGGLERGICYDVLDDYLCSGERDVTLIRIPSNGASIGTGFVAAQPHRVVEQSSLADAVAFAAQSPVDVVLLSPGAPSYDAYANYVAKAADFVRAIDSLDAVE